MSDADPASEPRRPPPDPGTDKGNARDTAPEIELSAAGVEADTASDGTEAPSRTSEEDLEAALDRALARAEPPTTDPDPIDAAIVVLRGRDAGRVFGFRSGSVLIGRAATAHIRLEEASVSQRHALIERVGDRFFVTDLGSSNGTSVNGIPISGATPLRNGDRIELVHVV